MLPFYNEAKNNIIQVYTQVFIIRNRPAHDDDGDDDEIDILFARTVQKWKFSVLATPGALEVGYQEYKITPGISVFVCFYERIFP